MGPFRFRVSLASDGAIAVLLEECFRVEGLEFMVSRMGLRVEGLRFRVWAALYHKSEREGAWLCSGLFRAVCKGV